MTTEHSKSTSMVQLRTLGILLVLVLLLSLGASLIQSDFGNTDVNVIKIVDDQGNTIVGKLYQPSTATSSNPAAAALLLHGLNNDKDTESPLAIELSRRGLVVLAIDEFNHGDSDNVGTPLGETTDMGAIAAFDYLVDQDFVDATNIGLVGHSMGGFSANATAFARPSHKAIVFQAFGPLNLTVHNYFNNYLQIVGRYEESAFMPRDQWISQGETMITYNVEQAGLQVTEPFGVTYGDFNAGTAQRYALTPSTHPGGTWKSVSIREETSWLLQALTGASATDSNQDAQNQVYYIKEIMTLVALLLTIISIIPLANLLLNTKFFGSITQELPDKIFYEGSSWWRIATINALIGGVTFVFFPFVGVLLFGAINGIIPIFGLLIGNAFLFWFLLNALIAWIIHRRWKKSEDDLTQDDLGGISTDADNRLEVIGKSLLLAFVIMAVIYLIAGLVQILFTVELRYMWAFFRLERPVRFFTMFTYIILISPFFLINSGAFLFGQARRQSDASNWIDLLKWSGYNIYNMASMIIVVFFIEYLPMILFGTGPLLGSILGVFWLLGIFLMQIIPEFIVLFTVLTILYQKTGRYYLGSFLGTIFIVLVMINGAFN